jgi:hypothetical protein
VTTDLGRLLEATRAPGGRVVWLDSTAYARRLLAPGEDVWVDVAPYVEFARQAQRLLGSDVIEVRLGDFHRAALDRDPTGGDVRGGRLLRVLRRLLEEEGPTRTAVDVVSALHSLFPGNPVVLVVDSAERWLRWAAAVSDAEWSGDVDDVDSAAVYLADAVRCFANAGVSAVVLDVMDDRCAAADALVDLHRPLLNLAGHYNWMPGVRVGGAEFGRVAMLDQVEVTLCPVAPFSAVAELDPAGYCGGGLDSTFWTSEECPPVPERALGYGQIPHDAHPERVLSRLSSLRS